MVSIDQTKVRLSYIIVPSSNFQTTEGYLWQSSPAEYLKSPPPNRLRKAHRTVLDLTGIILTKLEVTAKGRIVIGISSQLRMPMRFIGIGEQAADALRLFNADEFMQAIFDE